MKTCDFLIIGGGMSADAAAHGIRERDRNASIVMLSGDTDAPYDRPPLSKKLWTGKPLDSVWRRTGETGADLRLETRAVSGDTEQHTITDARGEVYRYRKLLLATGGVPRRLPSAPEGIIYYRTLGDYRALRELADRKAEILVIGGGFIGSEIAAALAMNECPVTLVFPDAAIGVRIYPPPLAQFLNDYFRKKGVTLMAGEKIRALKKSGSKYVAETESGKTSQADAVVAGIGIEPDVAFAKTLGLQVDNGIVVDADLRTSQPDVFAAGDVANCYSPALGVRRRVEHEDNANVMGAMAGRNMAGAGEKFEYLPYFYSDLFDLGYEAVGELDTQLDIVADWKEPFRKGVLYYTKAGRVRGVLLWDTWGQVDAARRLIESAETFDAAQLAGRIQG
jgi:NADPH-dependent 2,4-dienoyl-CoA reductase/sulfur reductase-like enzyme